MKLRQKHKEQTELHVGPLNDILFILLFFFLLASTFAGLNAMKVNLPKSSATKNQKAVQNFVVSVDSLGNTYFETKPIILDSLPKILQARYQQDTTIKSIVFNGDINAKYGAFAKVAFVAKELKLGLFINTKEGK